MRYNKLFIFALLVAACSHVKQPSVPSNFDYFTRLDSVSKQYIGAKYAIDPLGEGKGVDQDPLVRFDSFDCVTYVETVMAYAAPGDPIENKIKISYLDAKPNYIYRKHFWEMDQAQSGTLMDITANIGAPVKYISGTIDKKAWFAKKAPPVKTDFVPRKITLSYIAAADIPKINLKKLPHVSIIGIIDDSKNMPELIGTNNWNRHVGFVVSDGGKIVVRHASSSAGEVIEQSWDEFINHQMGLKNRIGIKIWEIKNVQDKK